MENINVFQGGNYIQYRCDTVNNGEATWITDRISSVSNTHIMTEKGLNIQKSLALSQFFPLPIVPEWLEILGFEQHCKEGLFSIWTISTQTADNKPITIIIIEHNENKEFYLSPINKPIHAHSLQNLYYNITGQKLKLPIKM